MFPRAMGYTSFRPRKNNVMIAAHAPSRRIAAPNSSNKDHDPIAGTRLIEKAVATEPNNSEVLYMATAFSNMIGRYDKAVALARRAVAGDPLCHTCYRTLARALMAAGRYDEAEAIIRRVIALGHGGWILLGIVELQKGRPEEALAAFDEHPPEDAANRLASRAWALHDLGREEESQAVLAELVTNWGDEFPVSIAEVYAWTDDRDSAFQWLDKASADEIDLYGRFYLQAWSNPVYRNLHGDLRWAAFMARVGLDAETLSQVEFEVLSR